MPSSSWSFAHLAVRREGPVEYLTLNRPEVRNAFNAELIAELALWAETMREQRDVRVVVLAGAGQAFCAGADVGWMAKTVHYAERQNLEDAAAAARMFAALDGLRVPIVGRVHGAALGGGAGLAAVCDVVVAEAQALFGFTEVKLGLLPAVIAPFVLAKIGRSAARELFLTGARFSAEHARAIGLAHAVVTETELDTTVGAYVREFLTAGPDAIAAAKELIRVVWNRSIDEVQSVTANAIAIRRVSPEGQEGLRAFLEKRKPSWSA